jgi:hypothetical protein
VPVPEHRSLGRAGRAGGEQEDGDLLLVLTGRLRLGALCAVLETLDELGVRDEFDPGDLADAVDDRRVHHHERRCVTRDEVAQAVVGQPVVHRHEGHARVRRSEQQDREQRRVQVQHREPLRPDVPDRGCVHQLGGLPRLPQQLRVGEAAVPRPDRDAVGHSLGGDLQQESDVHVPQFSTVVGAAAVRGPAISPRWGGAWRP